MNRKRRKSLIPCAFPIYVGMNRRRFFQGDAVGAFPRGDEPLQIRPIHSRMRSHGDEPQRYQYRIYPPGFSYVGMNRD